MILCLSFRDKGKTVNALFIYSLTTLSIIPQRFWYLFYIFFSSLLGCEKFHKATSIVFVVIARLQSDINASSFRRRHCLGCDESSESIKIGS